MKKRQYEVKIAGEWVTCSKAAEQNRGWLHYELRDHTVGLAQPKNWRIKGEEDRK